MLQKLEDFYLATLRFFVLLAATLLLLAVAILGFKSLGAMKKEPIPTNQTPTVDLAAVKSSVMATTMEGAPVGSPATTPSNGPNDAYYRATATSIKTFFDTLFPGQYDIDIERVAGIIRERAESDRSAEMAALFAKELASKSGSILGDKELIAYSQKRSPGEVVESVLNAFGEEFDRQVQSIEAEKTAAIEAYQLKKASALQSLLFAAYAFGVFLMIVFLSIIVRIERNLRPRRQVPNGAT